MLFIIDSNFVVLELSEANILKNLVNGGLCEYTLRTPQLIVEAKFVDILRHCNEQMIGELLVSGWCVLFLNLIERF